MQRRSSFLLCLFLSATLSLLPTWAMAQSEKPEKDDPFAHLTYRSIGPYNMSGRVSDVEAIPGDPRTVYVGSASGGIWRSTDGGITFEPIFDDQPVASIGDLALAPSEPAVIYVGTGEANVRNSVSFGNGVYRSNDGGDSWNHIGLEKTQTISRLAIHPRDPDRVFVGALGPIYGPSEERGVFRTTDGGQTWEKVLYLDDRHGVADLDLDPTNPNILYAAMWRFERQAWDHKSGGDGGGVYRSLDGGTTWEKLTKGLPKNLGRIAVKVAPSHPQTVYVMAESNDGILFRSDDRGQHFTQVSDDKKLISRGFYYTDLRVDPKDENRVYAVASRMFRSIDGGKTFERISLKTHIDYHSLWIDPEDPKRMWQGQDGGVAISYNSGQTWDPVRNLPLAQFYQVFADTREPFYYLGGGLQDNGTWYGPHRTREPAGILPDSWNMMSFGDAYFVVPHPEKVDVFISESQGGGILRTDMRNRQQIDISPQPRRNDGGPVGELKYRFNWNAPIIASPHDPHTVYFAGNVVFKTQDFGDTWEVISPDLTTDDPEKQGEAGGPIWFENTNAEYHCTIISLAESPVEAGLLWVGTDDGQLQLSRDAGTNWQKLTVSGVPDFSPVSHVEPSKTAAGTAYVTFDRHMFDDFRPHIYRTENFGRSWQRITDGLPEQGWVWVLREDPRQPNLIYAGTELGLHASWDRGDSWHPLHLGNFPAVAVHDLIIHPRENDLILGTHGRGIWVFDDATPIQQWNTEIAQSAAHLFPVRPGMSFPKMFTRYGLGDKVKVAPNPPDGVLITYHLKEALKDEEDEDSDAQATGSGLGEVRAKLEILDTQGEVVQTLKDIGLEAGLNRVSWNLRYDAPRRRDDSEGGNEFFGPPVGPRVPPGTYTARLTVDAKPYEQPITVRLDPTLTTPEAELAELAALRLEIRDMRSDLADTLRTLDALAAQLDERQGTLKLLKRELPEDLEAAWEDFAEKRKDLELFLARDKDQPRWSGGPELSDLLGDLDGQLDRGFQAPTAAQRQHFEELVAAYQDAQSRTEALFKEDLAAFNNALEAAGIPRLIASIGGD